MTYPILLRRIVINSTNKAVAVTENGVTETLNLVEGEYWLNPKTAEGLPNILTAFATMLATHSGANTYTVTMTWSADPDAASTVVTIARATGTNAFAILWANAATSFDPGVLGFAISNTANDTNAKVSTFSSNAAWVSPQPYRTFEVETEQDVVVNKSEAANTVRGGRLGGPHRARVLELRHIASERVEQSVASQYRNTSTAAFAEFLKNTANGGRFVVYLSDITSGFALTAPSSLDSVDVTGEPVAQQWIWDADTLASFKPRRHSPGLDLYDFDARMLARAA